MRHTSSTPLLPPIGSRADDPERGAILIVTALVMGLVLTSVALAVDIGHVVHEKRYLTQVADLAALDASQHLGSASTCGQVTPEAQGSATRNTFDWAHHTFTVETGTYDSTTNSFTPTDPSLCGTANAVRVTAGDSVPFAFYPGSKNLTTSAVATQSGLSGTVAPTAEVQVGSFLVRGQADANKLALRSKLENKLLTAIYHPTGGGPSVTLDAVGYQGLESASVSLGQLAAARGYAGRPDQLLQEDVTLGNLMQATVTALQSKGDTASLTAAGVVNALIATSIDGSLHLHWKDLLSVSGNAAGAVNATIDVYHLVTGAAEVANGSHLLQVTLTQSGDGLTMLPTVGTITMQMGLIGAPQYKVGPAQQVNGAWVTHVQTAQMRVNADLQLLNNVTVLPGVTAPVHIPLYLSGADASADLTGIQCALPTTSSHVTVQAHTSAASVSIGQVATATLTDPTVLNPIVNTAPMLTATGAVTVNGSASVVVNGNDQSQPFPVTHDNIYNATSYPFDWNDTTQIGAPANTVGSTLNATNSLSATVSNPLVNLATVESAVTSAAAPVLNGLDGTFLDGLTRAFSLWIGGADLTVPWQGCGLPALVK